MLDTKQKQNLQKTLKVSSQCSQTRFLYMGECQILFLGPESMHFENWAPNTSWGFVVVLVLQDILYTVNCILAFVLLSAYIVWLATHCERAFTF